VAHTTDTDSTAVGLMAQDERSKQRYHGIRAWMSSPKFSREFALIYSPMEPDVLTTAIAFSDQITLHAGDHYLRVVHEGAPPDAAINVVQALSDRVARDGCLPLAGRAQPPAVPAPAEPPASPARRRD
jgi:hypothetical protein